MAMAAHTKIAERATIRPSRVDGLRRTSGSTFCVRTLELANSAQAFCGLGHIQEAAKILKTFKFEEDLGEHRVFKEPIGVCGLITPWNWPVNQISCKVAPALAVGCTMVLKPSEVAPLSAYLFAQVMHEAGVPAGVFNMVNGDGPIVGTALSGHPDVDMMSFTGSTRAGTLVAQNAAQSVHAQGSTDLHTKQAVTKQAHVLQGLAAQCEGTLLGPVPRTGVEPVLPA